MTPGAGWTMVDRNTSYFYIAEDSRVDANGQIRSTP